MGKVQIPNWTQKQIHMDSEISPATSNNLNVSDWEKQWNCSKKATNKALDTPCNTKQGVCQRNKLTDSLHLS